MLKKGKTYKFDVNNDGKKDKIRLKQTKSYTKNGKTWIDVYINGQKKIKATGIKDARVYAFTTGKRTVLLSKYLYGDGASDFFCYYYKNKKYKKKELTSDGYFYSSIKVSDNYLRLYESPKGPWWLQAFNNMTKIPFKVMTTFKYSKGNLVKTTKYPGISGEKQYITDSMLELGSSISTAEYGDGPVVDNEDTFTLRSIVYIDGDYYYWIKNSDNESGWIKDTEDLVFYIADEY